MTDRNKFVNSRASSGAVSDFAGSLAGAAPGGAPTAREDASLPDAPDRQAP